MPRRGGRLNVGVTRSALLWASRNNWLKRHVPQWRFVRAATRRFLPGESVGAALDVARRFGARGLPTTITQLGENVTTEAEAASVTEHYLGVLDRIDSDGLDTEVSVKPSHLGYDLDRELAWRNLDCLVTRANEQGRWLWVDMEGSPYVDGTLALYRRTLERSPRVGLCVQAYLHRTGADIQALFPLRPSLRLVKGAYREPPDVAIQRKADVDASYLRLSEVILDGQRGGHIRRFAAATHDVALISRIDAAARSRGMPLDSFEVQMLYGIRQADQFRFVEQGRPTRCLVAYGPAWYSWYVRRLAERPANLWFVVRNVVVRGGPP